MHTGELSVRFIGIRHHSNRARGFCQRQNSGDGVPLLDELAPPSNARVITGIPIDVLDEVCGVTGVERSFGFADQEEQDLVKTISAKHLCCG